MSLLFTPLLFFQQWKLHIFELEEEMNISPSIKYVIYQVFITKCHDMKAVYWPLTPHCRVHRCEKRESVASFEQSVVCSEDAMG